MKLDPEIIKTAIFFKSSSSLDQCPVNNFKEVAFLGRSNVGKSSLINFLLDSKNLAKTSQTPGKTRLINHYLVNNSWYLVDLPGYGWAQLSKQKQKILVDLTKCYLQNRPNLSLILLLIDSGIPPQTIDIITLEILLSLTPPVSIVFTKIDRISKKQRENNIECFFSKLTNVKFDKNSIFLVSTKKNTGKKELLSHLIKVINN